MYVVVFNDGKWTEQGKGRRWEIRVTESFLPSPPTFEVEGEKMVDQEAGVRLRGTKQNQFALKKNREILFLTVYKKKNITKLKI